MKRCQGCGRAQDGWQIQQASVTAGNIQAWQLQLCGVCETKLEIAVMAAIEQMRPRVPSAADKGE